MRAVVGAVLLARIGADPVALHALRAQLRLVARARRHGGQNRRAGIHPSTDLFEHAIHFGIEPRGGRDRPRQRQRHDLHRRVADHFLHFRIEPGDVLIRQRANVERGLGFRGNHIRADPGLHDGRHNRRAQHRIAPRLVFGEIFLGRRRALWVQQGIVARRALGRADCGELLEVGPRGVVEAHGCFPGADFIHRRAQVRERVIEPRNRPVPRNSIGHQPDPRRDFFRRSDVHDADAIAFPGCAPALGDGELGVDRIEMLAGHEIDADPLIIRFLARFRQENHVPVERHIAALQQQHHHQIRGEVRLVVARAASPDVTVLHHRAKRIHRPLLALDGDHVGVRQDQHRPLAAVALQPCDQVRAVRVERKCLRRDAFVFEHFFQVFHDLGFVARRAAGIDLHQRAITLEDFRFLLSPVDRRGLGQANGSAHNSQDESLHSRHS